MTAITTDAKQLDPTHPVVKPHTQKSAFNYMAEKSAFRTFEDLKGWENAISAADNLQLFSREEMNRIYRKVEAEPHLASQWGTRKLKTLGKLFAVVNEKVGDDGKTVEDKAATALLTTRWFIDLLDEILNATLWGFRLIEIGPIDKNTMAPTSYQDTAGRFYDPINVINPDHVKPEWGIIVADCNATQGLLIEPNFKSTIFAGRRHDFGLLFKCVEPVLIKLNALANWSEWAEIFGHDLRVMKTDAEGDARLKAFNTLKMMGPSGFGIIDPEDEIIFAGTSRTDAFRVYQELINTIDATTSKVIFGQDVISNNTGQVVGEVGENVSNLYGDSDATFLERFINDTVFPKLIELGMAGLVGKRFKWDTSEKLTLAEQVEIDLKISQIGYKPAKAWLEEKYNIKLEEPEPEPTADPAQVSKSLRNLYPGAI